MIIHDNDRIERHTLPGVIHQTLDGPRDGTRKLEVWMQTIAAGAETPLHRHDCEEVIVVLRGAGACEIAGVTHSFGPNSTLIVPPNVVHKIANTSDEEMWIVGALSMAPVVVHTADGAPLPLPWDQSEFAG
jgi:quercetin dioxygenase-like cupin family protein